MKWYAMVTSGKGRKRKIIADTVIIADDVHTAHRYARTVLADCVSRPAVSLSVMPCADDNMGLIMGALTVARISAKRAIMWGASNDTQIKIDRDLRAAHARITGADSDSRAMDVIASMGHDAQDYYSTCQLALLQARNLRKPIRDMYDDSYTAIRAYIRDMRSRIADISMDYITTDGGDIVALTTIYARIIDGNARKGRYKYTPIASDTMTDEDALLLGDTIHDAVGTMQDVHRDVVKYLARGYSVRGIAIAMDTSPTTTQRRIIYARKIIADYIRAHTPQFACLVPPGAIDSDTTNATVKGGRKDAQYYRDRRASAKN